MISRAFVLGAGLGTRLRPLTEGRPKPLVPLFGKPLITFAMDHLLSVGIRSFVVNTHHQAAAYGRLMGAEDGRTDYRGCEVLFRHEPVLLDTGGGLRNAADLLGDQPFVVYNGDVLADFPLEPLIERHLSSGNLATLALRTEGGPLHVQCDPGSGRLTDIRGAIGGRHEPAFLFTGVSVVSPQLFTQIPLGAVISVIPIYLKLLRQGLPVGGHVIKDGLWFDLGTRDSYLAAHEWLATNRLSHAPADWPRAVADSARVDGRLEGTCAVGDGATVGAGAILEDCVLWENACVESGARLTRCIVRDGKFASGTGIDIDF